MTEVLAEIHLSNIYIDCIFISKSSDVYRKKGGISNEAENLLFEPRCQGFVWYRDFVAFKMLAQDRSYWVKLAVSETLEIDQTLIKNEENRENVNGESVIVLPFQVVDKDRLYVFGGDNDIILSFTLPVGNYKLLFQNRLFTKEEIEANPNNDYQDLEYDDDCDYIPELCMLTFIPTKEAIEPEILMYDGSLKSNKAPTPLILFDQEMYTSRDNF